MGETEEITPGDARDVGNIQSLRKREMERFGS